MGSRRGAAILCAVLAWCAAATAHGEAAEPAIAPALSIPAMAASPQAFVPAGFSLLREVTGNLIGTDTGVAQVYENDAGRRALLIGVRHAAGFEATGWGFVLPCRSCGADLPGDRNLDVTIRQHEVVVVDRSDSRADGVTTRAESSFRFDAASRHWRLATLTQTTVYTQDGRAEQSFIDYVNGDTRDATGRDDGGVFFAENVQTGRITPRDLPLDTLTLY